MFAITPDEEGMLVWYVGSEYEAFILISSVRRGKVYLQKKFLILLMEIERKQRTSENMDSVHA